MTEEEAFKAAIDADPTDGANRMVFADWLEERGDVRAEGYRMLGRYGKFPGLGDDGFWRYWGVSGETSESNLGIPWFWLPWEGGSRCSRPSEVDDAAAEAFSRLTGQEKAETIGSFEFGK